MYEVLTMRRPQRFRVSISIKTMLPPRLLRTTWSRRNRNRFVFPPILSRLTQEEALAELLVILANESVLGHIMAVPTHPHSSNRQWPSAPHLIGQELVHWRRGEGSQRHQSSLYKPRVACTRFVILSVPPHTEGSGYTLVHKH